MTDLQLEKRGPGRPKGTKNKPGARAGRPRKDDLKVQQKERISCTTGSPQQETGSPAPPHRHAAKADNHRAEAQASAVSRLFTQTTLSFNQGQLGIAKSNMAPKETPRPAALASARNAEFESPTEDSEQPPVVITSCMPTGAPPEPPQPPAAAVLSARISPTEEMPPPALNTSLNETMHDSDATNTVTNIAVTCLTDGQELDADGSTMLGSNPVLGINKVVSGKRDAADVTEGVGVVELDKEGGAECRGPGTEPQPNECHSVILMSPASRLAPPPSLQAAEQSSQLPSLPAVPNPYGSDLRTAFEIESSETNNDDGEDLDLAGEFSRCDDEELLRHEIVNSDVEVNSRNSQSARSSKPSWLSLEYQRLRERLHEEMRRNTSRAPTCYDRKSFYEGVDSPFLAAKVTYQLDAAIFYQPRFFIWLPHCLVDRIPCPACLEARRQPMSGPIVFLQKHGFTDRCRRVVDINRNVYIVGYRYLCGHPDCKRVYQSWSPDILKVLPPAIARSFEFRLTYRSGLSRQLTMLLRNSFRSGIGPDQFTTMIESFHYQRFDELQAQFLEMVLDRSTRGSLSQYWTAIKPFSDFGDPDGYAGFVPSAAYFGHFYDMLVEESSREIHQMIASLPADVLKQDHSFKTIKRMVKVGGEATYHATFSTANLFGEIRSMNLTPTLSQAAWGPILGAMLPSLEMFGHGHPKYVWTDNINADKAKLQSVFPSLTKNVKPVSTPNTCESLSLPWDWSVEELPTAHHVNLRFSTIMSHHSSTSPITVSFGIQWPVDPTTGNVGRISLIQVGYQKTVYLIKTANLMREGHISLPHRLLAFLQSQAYRKVGINTLSNLRRLWNDSAQGPHLPPFLGDVDLQQLAKARTNTHQTIYGIEGLCSLVLRKHIPRDPAICVSKVWSQTDLPTSFVNHAVLETYTLSSLYSALSTMQCSREVSMTTPGGTHVKLFSPDGRVVATGIIALDRPATFNSVKVTKTRVLMTVDQVFVPGYLISPTLLSNQQPTPLSAFGPVPFNLLCLANHLQTSSSFANEVQNHELATGSSTLLPPLEDPLVGMADLNEDIMLDGPSPIDLWIWDIDSEGGSDNINDSESELRLTNLPLAESEQQISNSPVDLAAHNAMCQLLLDIRDYNPESAQVVRTRVLGDIWHVFHQFPISLHHGLRRPFARALSRAFFIPNQGDKRAVDEVLRQQNTTYEAKLRFNPAYIRKRVQYRVPPPEKLYSRIAAVIKTFGPRCDATTKQPLFNEKAWNVAKNVLEHIRNGDYSDPPDISVYFQIGKDKNGLNLYRCFRGTNDVEGGIHQNLIRRFTSFNVSPRRAVNMMLDYICAHNMQVGTLNRTGQRYIGHFDVSLKNQIAGLHQQTSSALHQHPILQYSGWINGNNYEQTREVFGILPFDEKTRLETGMLPYDDQLVNDVKPRHQWLSKQQGTRFAVVPIHTHDERRLFHSYAESSPLFTSQTGQPDFLGLCQRMNERADGKTFFYKLPEHMRSFYKKWQDYHNEKISVTLSNDAIPRVRHLLEQGTSTLPMISALIPQPLANTVKPPVPPCNAMSHSDQNPSLGNWQLKKRVEAASSLPSALTYHFGQPHPSPTTADSPLQSTSNLNPSSSLSPSRTPRQGQKRAAEDELDHGQEKKGRKARRCLKCESIDCPGRWQEKKCTALPKQPADHHADMTG